MIPLRVWTKDQNFVRRIIVEAIPLSKQSLACFYRRMERDEEARNLAAKAIDMIANEATLLEGVGLIERALAIGEALPEPHLAVVHLMLNRGQLPIAAQALEAARQRGPDHPEVSHLSRLLALAEGKLVETEGLPVEDFMRLGATACHRQDFSAAERWFKMAAPAGGALALAHLAEAQAYQGKKAEALLNAQHAFARSPEIPQVADQLALCLLANGQPGEAWDLLENRLKSWRLNSRAEIPNLPQWDDTPLNGKRLLVWREEGIGDEIRHWSCLVDLFRTCPTGATIECSPRILGLLQRSFPEQEFRPEVSGKTDVTGFDFQLPSGSLPRIYRRKIEDFPNPSAYLKADPKRVDNWRKRLAGLGSGPKIGISWRSQNHFWRKMPFHSSLAEWEAVFAIPGLNFINLQWEDFSAEIADAEARFAKSIHRFADLDLKNDIEEVAALLTALDGVVSGRNTVNWLAGALGKESLVFAAHPNEMMLEAPRDPWFPTTRIFYRSHGEDWRRVMSQITKALTEKFPSA
jgi:hypothetical protein